MEAINNLDDSDRYDLGEITRYSPIPLYYQVSQILRRQIELGRYKPGDFIPTEGELQNRFKVSRATVRQGIAELVYAGLVERLRSKGTIVCVHQPETTLRDLASFTNEIIGTNSTLKTQILSFMHIQPPEDIARNLTLQPPEEVAMMERVRYVNGSAVAVEKWYAALRYFPGLEKDMFKETGMEQSTYHILMKHYKIKITRAEDTVSPVGVEAREGKILGVSLGHPALLRTRISYDSFGRPVTFGSGVYLIRLRFFLGEKETSYPGKSRME
jgi:GntR family transcriptional regulator